MKNNQICFDDKTYLLIFCSMVVVGFGLGFLAFYHPIEQLEQPSQPIITEEKTTEFWECSKEEITDWNYFEQTDNYDHVFDFYYPVNFPRRLNKEPVGTVCFKKLVFEYIDLSSLRCDSNYENCKSPDYNYSYCAAGKHPVKTCVEWIYKKKVKE